MVATTVVHQHLFGSCPHVALPVRRISSVPDPSTTADHPCFPFDYLSGFSADLGLCEIQAGSFFDGVLVVLDHQFTVDVLNGRRPLGAIDQGNGEIVKVLTTPIVVLGITFPTFDGSTW